MRYPAMIVLATGIGQGVITSIQVGCADAGDVVTLAQILTRILARQREDIEMIAFSLGRQTRGGSVHENESIIIVIHRCTQFTADKSI